MAQPSPTPSSEIIHLVSTFADTLDSLPPSLTRSLSDLKELDAVLSGELPLPYPQKAAQTDFSFPSLSINFALSLRFTSKHYG